MTSTTRPAGYERISDQEAGDRQQKIDAANNKRKLEIVSYGISGQPARTYTPEQAAYLNSGEHPNGYLEAYHLGEVSAWLHNLVVDGFFSNYPEDYQEKVKFSNQLISDLSKFVSEKN